MVTALINESIRLFCRGKMAAEKGLQMDSISDFPRTNSRLWVRTASMHTQASNRRGRLPKGSFVIPGDRRDELVGATDALVLAPVAGLVRDRLPNTIICAMNPRSGAASLVPTKVPLRRW